MIGPRAGGAANEVGVLDPRGEYVSLRSETRYFAQRNLPERNLKGVVSRPVRGRQIGLMSKRSAVG